jgi:hypothetical protein
VTFCTLVSVATLPKLYMISLYYNTFTKDSFVTNQYGILQLLRPCQKVLIPILGKHSGYDTTYTDDNDNNNKKEYYNKRIECTKVGYPWVSTELNYNNKKNNIVDNDKDVEHEYESTIDLLPNCVTYLHVKIINRIPAGDHLLVLCQHINTYQWDDDTKSILPSTTTTSSILDHHTVLYTGQLREEGII